MRTIVYFMKASLFLVCLMSVASLSGCKPRLLPSTNVPATRENKKVVKFLEQYKLAVERRSVDAIMELVAKDYNDNMGSEDPALHVNYLSLKEKLEQALPRIQDIRLGMFVQHIAKLEKNNQDASTRNNPQDNSTRYETVFYFNKQILLDVPSGQKWISLKEVSRMVIRRRNDKDSPYEFEIIQGL